MLPSLLIILLITVYPFISTVWFSFHKMRLNVPEDAWAFIGFKNYIKVLSSSRFHHSFYITVIFSLSWVFFQFLFGMGIALVLNMNFRGRAFVRATVLIPWAMALVITAILWQWMYNPVFGVFNALLKSFGLISENINWLEESEFTIFFSILVVELWQHTPFMALILLAGLQGISAELYDAAKIDGANKFNCFIHVTLPNLKHAMLVALLFRSIDAFRSFDILYTMTQGGPGRSTEILSLFAYKTMFQYLNFGKGSTIAVIMAVITTILSIIYIRILSSKD